MRGKRLKGLPSRYAKRDFATPVIAECYANFECGSKYNVFVFEVVKAHVAASPKYPQTIPYRGDGEFMMSGANTRKYRRLFGPDMLG